LLYFYFLFKECNKICDGCDKFTGKCYKCKGLNRDPDLNCGCKFNFIKIPHTFNSIGEIEDCLEC
jgi:hypothetical protein